MTKIRSQLDSCENTSILGTMPLYEYKCTNCQKISEFILRQTEAPTEGCRHCGEKKIERVLYSTFAIAGAGSSACESSNFCSDAHKCGGGCKH
ncbi:MAG: hypothetical protein COV46_00190 [Deltaproteobacteria bacterium CG11_big_fil_rev_8_21_14_0_20_49_13]|nr:MAG: hypothetical protein COV46_00190 [Deltaproteobacteria bacterium CG11_big_fil_rev_8_21_14_0_20_49_13]